MYDDYSLVTGLKSTDQVLVFGDALFTGLKDLVNNVETARRGKELTRYSSSNAEFDRTFVTVRRDALSAEAMVKLTAMNRGLLVLFVEDADHEDALLQWFLKFYPWHDIWVLNTNVGRAVVTSAKGPQEWLD